MSSYALGPEWAVDPAYDFDGFESAAGFSTIGQRRRGRGNHCRGNNDTCKAFKSKGTDYCAGHLRSMQKDEK